METELAHNILEPGECNYYTVQQLNSRTSKISNEAFSIIHLNSQSLKRKLPKIKQLFSELKQQFKVIAITETWLIDIYVDLVQIEGYK